MPKNLSNRLEKLENDIQVLLMLQQVSSTTGTDTCNCVATQSTTSTTDTPSKGETCIKLNNNCSGTSTSTLYRRVEPSVSYCPSQTQHRTGEQKTDYRMNMKLTYYPPGTAPRQKSDNRRCEAAKKRTRSAYVAGSETCRRSSTNAIKSKDNIDSPSNYCIPVEKYESTMQELQAMRQKCGLMETTVERLRTVLEGNRVAMQDMIQSKKLALDMAKQLREKYETMRTARKSLMAQIDHLKVENSGLSSELEKALVVRKDLSEQMQCMQGELDSIARQRDEAEQQNKQLQCKVCCLEQQVSDLENQLQYQEQDFQRELEKRVTLDSPEVQNLVRTHSVSLQTRLDEQCQAYNIALERKAKELHDIQCRCYSLENDLKAAQEGDDRKVAETEAELAKVKASMEKKEKLLLAESEELKKLVMELTNMLKQNENKCSETEEEFRKYKCMMEEKGSLMLTERDELKKLVQELTDMLKQNKNRIDELSDINKQQEALIQSQTEVISSKEEQVHLSNQEVDVMNRQITELENQVLMLRASVDMYEKMKDDWANKTYQFESDCQQYQTRNQALEKEVQCCRCALDAEKDKLLIKTKIIDDQNESIKQLKNSLNEKAEELKRLTKDLEQAEKDITQEKLSKQKLMNKVSHLQRQREQLEEQVTELEDALEKQPSTVHQRLQDLEVQVDNKQKEWELQLKVLTKEKEQALKAARFAAEKLFETTNQFQKQVTTQRKVQRMLTSLLTEKEAQLKAASQQIISLNSNLETNIRQTNSMQKTIEAKLLQAREAFSEVLQDVTSKTKIC